MWSPRARPPPASAASGRLHECHATSPTPSHFSLALWTSLPLAPLFPPHGRVCRRRRSLLPRPPGLPRPSNVLESSATPSPSTPPSHVIWEAPQRPRRPHLLPRPQEIAAGIPTPSSLPRARFDDLCNHRELPRRNPLSPSSITPSSRASRHTRAPPSAMVVALAATVHLRSRLCLRRAAGTTRPHSPVLRPPPRARLR